MVSHNLTDSVQWQLENFSSHRYYFWTVSNPVKASQHHLIVYLHFSCVDIQTAELQCRWSSVRWLTDLSPGSVSLGRCGRVKDIFYCVGPSRRHCVLAVEQLSPYSRPGLTVISPPALLTTRPDCFSTIWDRQVRPGQGCHLTGTGLIHYLEISCYWD